MSEKAITAQELADKIEATWARTDAPYRRALVAAEVALSALPPLRAREEIARAQEHVRQYRDVWRDCIDKTDAEASYRENWDGSDHNLQAFDAVMDAILSSTAGQEWRDISSAGSYLIWSNEHRAWWRPNSCGYTIHLAAAGRYSRDDAIKHSRTRDQMPGEMMPEIPVRESDVIAAVVSAPPVAEPLLAERKEPQLKDIHLRLLRRGASGEYIGLSDNMGIRTGELAALGELHRMGFAERAKGPFPPGPPSPTPSVITDAGRAFLADKSEVKS